MNQPHPPFVLSLSKHIFPLATTSSGHVPFDRLRANGCRVLTAALPC